MRFLSQLLLGIVVVAISFGVGECSKKEAYVTLVYGNSFDLPARVLLQSLKETGTKRELVAMVTPDVDTNAKLKLHNLGVTVVDVPVVKNPYVSEPHYQQRFAQVLTKLCIWNLTDYETLVMLDADTLVFQNIDELFECGEFCAAFINPTTFNSGVMVLKPSKQVFNDMMEKLAAGVASYDSGDQGFLNNYFPKLLEAPLFDGNLSRKDDTPQKRLASMYHTDHVLYYPRFAWDSHNKPAVIEFIGLRLLKPWLWWSYIVMDLSWVWASYRDRLPEFASDRSHDMFIMRVLIALPLVMIGAAFTVFWYLRNSMTRHMCAFFEQRTTVSVHTVTLVAGMVGLGVFGFSVATPMFIIPSTAPAPWAWTVFFMWTYTLLLIVFGAFCGLCYVVGRYSNSTIDRPFEAPTAPFRMSCMLGFWLVAFSVTHYLVLSHGGFVELFHKAAVLVFGIFFSIILHFMVLSRIAFLWFTYGLAKGNHYSRVSPSFDIRPWTKAPTLLIVIAANCIFLFLLVWAISGTYPGPTPNVVPEQRKFVVISSDDWGRWTDATAIWPNMSYWQQFHEKGVPGSDNKMNGWTYATAETAHDMREFFDFLEEMNMEAGKYDHRVVITPFWTVGGPDMESMKALGCPESPRCEYRELLADHDSGLQKAPFYRGDLKPVYMHGFKKRLWHPEYHARTHFDHKKWLNLLQVKKDAASLACFEMDLVCATVGYDLRSENTMFDNEKEQFAWFEGGVNTFEKIWGYKPAVHSSPHNVTGKYLANIVKQLDFTGVDNPIPGAPEDAVSTIDRARFDPFNLNFDWDTTWKMLLEELQSKSHLSLAFHAQNTFTEMYTEQQHKDLMDVFRKAIRKLREYPGVVFVTSSELHQIRTKGWSMELWSDSFVFRNYSPRPVTLKVKNLKSMFYYGPDWSGRSLELIQLNGPENERTRERTEVGAVIHLQPNNVYELRLEEY